jgi:hypothetical protein
MGSWFVRPEVVRVPLSDGEWVTLKKRLTAGESRDAFARMCHSGIEPLTVNPLQIGLAQMLAYLVEWSLTDDDGQPVSLLQQPVDVVERYLLLLEPERFDEIRVAVLRHEAEQVAARAEQKKTRDTATASPSISRSLVGVGGGTSG